MNKSGTVPFVLLLSVVLIGCRGGAGGIGVPGGLPGTSPIGGPGGSVLPSLDLPSGEISPPSLDWPSDGERNGEGDSGEAGEGQESAQGPEMELPDDMLPESTGGGLGSALPTPASSDTDAEGNSDATGIDPSQIDWTEAYEGLGAYGGGGAATASERVAAAEAALDSALSDYDDVIRKEQAASPQSSIDTPSNTGMDGRSTGSGDLGSAVDPTAGADGQTGEFGTASGYGSSPDRAPDKKIDAEGQPVAKPEPNRGSAQDDDVVARQLREAAEAETDPELKAKLWEEYRRYKEGL